MFKEMHYSAGSECPHSTSMCRIVYGSNTCPHTVEIKIYLSSGSNYNGLFHQTINIQEDAIFWVGVSEQYIYVRNGLWA